MKQKSTQGGPKNHLYSKWGYNSYKWGKTTPDKPIYFRPFIGAPYNTPFKTIGSGTTLQLIFLGEVWSSSTVWNDEKLTTSRDGCPIMVKRFLPASSQWSFGVFYSWPFQGWKRDLHLGYQKITWKKLVGYKSLVLCMGLNLYYAGVYWFSR